MLDVPKTLVKLEKAPEIFKEHMDKGRYCAAKWCFFQAFMTALFIDADDKTMDKLFGEQGLFPPDQVRKAYREAGAGNADKGRNSKKTENTTGDVYALLPEERVLESDSDKGNNVLCGTVHGA